MRPALFAFLALLAAPAFAPRGTTARKGGVGAGARVWMQAHAAWPLMLDRLRLAHAQLRGRFDFRVVYLIGDGRHDRCPRRGARLPPAALAAVPPWAGAAGLARLRAALGNRTVVCLDPPKYEAMWPRFFERMRSLPTRERYRKHGAIDGFDWAWTHCDLHAVLAESRMRATGRTAAAGTGGGADVTWVLDADVGWTGDLGAILSAFDAQPQHLLTGEPSTAHANEGGYRQFALRNYLAPSQVRQTSAGVH